MSLVEGAGLPEHRWPLLVCQEQEEGLQGWTHHCGYCAQGPRSKAGSPVGPSYCLPATYGLSPAVRLWSLTARAVGQNVESRTGLHPDSAPVHCGHLAATLSCAFTL